MKSHQGLGMESIKATTAGGKVLLCRDLFTYAVQCGEGKGCQFVTTSGQSTNAGLLGRLKDHWEREHPDSPNREPLMISLMPGKKTSEAEPISPVKRGKYP